MDIFTKIAERKIRESIEAGEFDNIEGRGKPLVFKDETWIPEDLRIAYRCMKNSGFIPPELELRNEIISLKDLINTIDDDSERMKKLRLLNFKMIRLSMMKDREMGVEREMLLTERLLDRSREE